MSNNKLSIVLDESMFGTTVRLVSTVDSYDEIVGENIDTSPLLNMRKRISGGYLFKSPNIQDHTWPDMIASLRNMSGKFAITAVLNSEKKTVTAFARFVDQDDAAIFALANMHNWQKWSDAQEKEALKEAKASKKSKIHIGKNGKITATVKVKSLGAITP